jgi:hypothetical protein
MNKFSIMVGVLQACAAIEAGMKGNAKMGVVFGCSAICSVIFAYAK